MKKTNYSPVDVPEGREVSLSDSGIGSLDDNSNENRDGLMIQTEAKNFELESGIDFDAVDGLVGDIKELKKGLFVLLILFIAFGGFIALDDYYTFHNKYHDILGNNDEVEELKLDGGVNKPPHPHMGHKLQINASAFTVNDYECLQLDTGNWPSERVHCELRPNIDDDVPRYDIVVEHFDDKNCQKHNAQNPLVRHTASGCFFFESYNHSYNDLCHVNRTLTISAFYGPGCTTPMPVTALNVLPEDGE